MGGEVGCWPYALALPVVVFYAAANADHLWEERESAYFVNLFPSAFRRTSGCLTAKYRYD